MFKKKFSNIKSIIKDAKKGKMFILVDDKNRENEGDLIIPASKCNSKSINFMAKHIEINLFSFNKETSRQSKITFNVINQ